MTRDRTEDAVKSIRQLRGPEYSEGKIAEELEDIAQHIKAERDEAAGSYFAIFRGTDLRRTHIACGCVIWQVLSGISFVNAVRCRPPVPCSVSRRCRC